MTRIIPASLKMLCACLVLGLALMGPDVALARAAGSAVNEVGWARRSGLWRVGDAAGYTSALRTR